MTAVATGGPGVVYAVFACLGAAAWLAHRPGGAARRARLLLGGGTATAAHAPPAPRAVPVPRRLLRHARRVGRRLGPHWLAVPTGALLGVAGGSVLPALVGVAAVPVLGRRLARREAARAAERRAAAVVELCASVAAELRAGRQPEQALTAAGVDAALGDTGAAVVAAARFGGDVPGALRRAARQAGAEGLNGAAACWRVAVDGGAGLADGLDRVAEALRGEHGQREELRAQLAGPRSTAVALALLPVLGLLLGTAMGAQPLRFLFHSPAGWAVLGAATLLEWAGLAWTARIVRTAEGARRSPRKGSADDC
ncbi:type II secretion system F family protein [Streptomyces sp. TRM70308]|uniref:type II secretion system F family protein n=1 Tax=Streptomyces sp. TRM70308 TaxID=3131932 RepID=UPI003D015F13